MEVEIEEIINLDYVGNVEIDLELDLENFIILFLESDELEEEEYKKDLEIFESESVFLYVLLLSDLIYFFEIIYKEYFLLLCVFFIKNYFLCIVF